VVPPKDEQALVRVMDRCMMDAPSRSAVAAHGHREVQRYAWPMVAQTAEAIYRSAG
jgi:hypothetical protein